MQDVRWRGALGRRVRIGVWGGVRGEERKEEKGGKEGRKENKGGRKGEMSEEKRRRSFRWTTHPFLVLLPEICVTSLMDDSKFLKIPLVLERLGGMEKRGQGP